jgi:hypothetical protein
MPTGRHLSSQNKALAIVVALIVIGVGLMFMFGDFAQKSEPALTGENTGEVPAPGTPFLEPAPTDTVVTGAIDAVGTGQGQDELILVQKKGEVVTNTKLILDDHSYCNMGTGGLPCMAMSVTYSTAFGGKRALVDGNKEGDSIRVRRLRVEDGDAMPRVTAAGSVYIPWVRMHDMILNCEAQSLMQTHEGLVTMKTKTDKTYVAVEPVIDEVFKTANEAGAACGSIGLGTE